MPIKKEIALMYGDSPSIMVPRLLDYFEVARRISQGAQVGIKPNLVVSKPSDSGATTDPRIAEAVVVYLLSHGIHNIRILESVWVGDDTESVFDVCGYRAVAKKYNVALVDLKADRTSRRDALGIDYLINQAMD